MSPLDDELRTALASRTAGVGPGADLFAGVERRARRMRRQRAAATVAGSAMAVTALGLGGPLVASSLTSTVPGPSDLATTQPAPAPSYALDPADPWPYRGVPLEDLGTGTVEAVRVQLAAVRAVDVEDVTLTPLYGQLEEPSQGAELVYVARVEGAAAWGVARTGEAGPEVVLDADLSPPALALTAALPGEAVSRLLVLAAPGTTVQYCPTNKSSCTDAGGDGVGRAALDGDPVRHAYRVLAEDGSVVDEGAAPDGDRYEGEGEREGEGEGPGTEAPPGDEVATPTNAVDWPTVGGASPELVEAALTRYAEQEGVTREQVGGRLLYGYEPPGQTQGYLLLQVWSGGDARALGASYDRRSGTVRSTSLSGPIAPGPAVLGVLFPGGASGAMQQLLVLPEPRAAQVLYSPDGTSERRPVASQGTGAAVLLPRAGDAAGDRLLVLDADGDLDRPVLRGTVDGLLASMR